MGRIDKRGCQDRVMERRHIELMLRNIDEYESVKRGNHDEIWGRYDDILLT